MFRRARGFLLILLLLFPNWVSPVLAQDEVPEIAVFLFPPSTTNFPEVKAFLDVHDSTNQFVHGLQPGNLTILEDQNQITDLTLEELRPGIQAAVVVIPGSTFALRNSQGISRFDVLVENIRGWLISKKGSDLDDLSLIFADGPRIIHESNPQEIINTIETPIENTRQAVPNLDMAFQAVEIAADPSKNPGMEKIVILLIPPLDNSFTQSLENLTARALEQGVRIFIWMVGPDDPSTQLAAERIKAVAESTSGQFGIFDGESTLVFEDQLEPLRETYQFTYSSLVRSSGVHQLSVEVQADQGIGISQVQNFEINLVAPAPAFVQPPLEIIKKPPETSDEDNPEIPLSEYVPKAQELQIIIDYPDAQIHPITRTSLFVDGVVVQENKQAPFDRFTWELSGYLVDGSHSLRVEAQDSLGQVGSSIEQLVQVSVKIPETNWTSVLTRNLPILAGLAILLAGAFLFLVLVLGGRLRPFQPGKDKSAKRLRKKKFDALTQAVLIPSEVSRSRTPWTSRLQWPQRPISGKVLAFLTPIETDNSGSIDAEQKENRGRKNTRTTSQSPIPIHTDDLTIGSDPSQSLLLLTDPSLEGLHARLYHQADNHFKIYDKGTVAGTWVNYSPVPKDGMLLEHGDLIHFGRLGFRFTLRHPDRSRKTAPVRSGQISNPVPTPPSPQSEKGNPPAGNEVD